MSELIQPYTIAIAQREIDDLRRRLEFTRWPDREPVSDWSQGVPLAYMQELAEYWLREYNWRVWENRLNSWGQFTTCIEGVDIQFMHIRSPHDGAMPLLITHGWPGSMAEFQKIIEPLSNPTACGGRPEDAFHLVLPTLPGYGFSGKPEAPGWNVDKIGLAWAELMARLGYERYVAQGGDWGAIVSQAIAQLDTAHCAGIHVTLPLVAPDPATMDDLQEIEVRALAQMNHYEQWDSGYAKQQSTRPQTLGYGLADSPVGQAAWIVEKFWSWMDCGETDASRHPENILSRDELLDNISTYWFSNAGASSGRLYWESLSSVNLDPISIPVGCSIFPKEIMYCSRRWAEQRFSQLIHWNEFDSGGHFAALEKPDCLVSEIRKCFNILR